MAKFLKLSKWRKRTLTALSVAFAATFSLSVLAACATTEDETEEDTSVLPTDTQVIKNGNFEFFDEMEKEYSERLSPIATPSNWTFSSGSPSSTATSGLISAEDAAWKDLTRTGGYAFETYTYTGDSTDYHDQEVKTFTSVADAVAHWTDDGVSTFDRLYFKEVYASELEALDADSEEAKFFADYAYTITYEDVKYLGEELGATGSLKLHKDVTDGENSVLMIHNLVTSNSVVGTAQYYSSSTTITLAAGTAAKVSVWVRTDNLYHYGSTDTENPNKSGVEVTQRAGAYVGVTNTVGGTTLDQMQIKNINTKGEWEQYEVYVRASTFATSTFRIVLGLGQGSSTDRYYNVNGYALFDDLECEIISGEEYLDAVGTAEDPVANAAYCSVDSLKEEKLFDMDDAKYATTKTYVLDLYAAFDADDTLLSNEDYDYEESIGLTSEKSGSITYTTERYGLGDIADNFAKLTTLSEIAASNNKYLTQIYENDLKDQYPFGEDGQIVMLMSSNGAAYTATLPTVTIGANERMLISFFAKTSSLPSGYSGAGAIVSELVNGATVNKTAIAAFDSTTLATVDIDSDDESKSDIYKGWTQCFFFIENATDYERQFSVALVYGDTTITGKTKTDFVDGYAAFTNFETKFLTKTEYSYATTGDRAVKVSLTGEVKETKTFDSLSAAAQKDVETKPALPANFTGVLGGSSFVTAGGADNVLPENVYTGLLNSEYASTYFASTDAWRNILAGDQANSDIWWTEYFGNARQPLVILNGEASAYGYFSGNLSVSASSKRQISMRVKVSDGAKAYIYLTDVSSAETTGSPLFPEMPQITYWYNDFGDICSKDPSSKDYNRKTDILYELQDNGLYLKVGGDKTTYYANFYNYDKDDDGNLVTSDGTIAFYLNDGKYYAYGVYDDSKDVTTYSQVVECLPTTDDNGKDITRYNYTQLNKDAYGSCIVVDNTNGDYADWVTVSFFVSTGTEAKSYRLEVWSGDRTGEVKNPENSYVFFDNLLNDDASSSYATLLEDAVAALKKQNGLSDKENLPADIALYYTFTFYDAQTYLRYDVNEDEELLGNPYGSYTQSEQTEQLVYLTLTDKNGSLLNSGSMLSLFLDYAAADVEVAKDDLSSSDSSDDSDSEIDPANILLIISSSLLAVVLLAVILILIFRQVKKRVDKNKKKAKKNKADRKKEKAASRLRIVQDEEEAEEPAPVEEEDNPYNE